MNLFDMKRVAAAALIGLTCCGSALPAFAAMQDYEFQLVSREVNKGDAIIAVRLINKKTGKPVPDAVIFATRLDMAPDRMQEMVSKVTPLASPQPGVYAFRANLSMAGGWQLSLGAKIQGETGSLQNTLVFKALP